MIEEEVVRRGRLLKLQEAGKDPYPPRCVRTHTVAQFLHQFDHLLESQGSATLTGRLKTKRKHGGLTFGQLEDASETIQLAFRRDALGEEVYAFLHETIDMGDILEVTGVPFITKAGERSLSVNSYTILSKTLLPLPEKWHGLTDVETRYREREVDLLSNPQVRAIFKTRAMIVRTIRHYLDEQGFLEVDTPILQINPGGASARPFKTHHNALDTDMYLRVAPELYLKRCVVGGLERVYEVARCFRNEGIDHSHNPEFTQIEGYAAYMDYRELMDFLETMVRKVVVACGLDPAAVPFQGYTLDFASPWPRVTFTDIMKQVGNVDIEALATRTDAAKLALERGVPVATTDSHMTIVDNIYKHLVRPKIIQPTYLYDYPAEMTPLAKRKPEDPRYVEMFQLVYGGGVENVKAFTELNDPIDQEERFREQDAARANGDEEAQFSDQEYVNALKHGLPPTAGFGIGIDRLAATLTDSHNLKEVILFPTLRPEAHE